MAPDMRTEEGIIISVAAELSEYHLSFQNPHGKTGFCVPKSKELDHGFMMSAAGKHVAMTTDNGIVVGVKIDGRTVLERNREDVIAAGKKNARTPSLGRYQPETIKGTITEVGPELNEYHVSYTDQDGRGGGFCVPRSNELTHNFMMSSVRKPITLTVEGQTVIRAEIDGTTVLNRKP